MRRGLLVPDSLFIISSDKNVTNYGSRFLALKEYLRQNSEICRFALFVLVVKIYLPSVYL